MKSTFFIFLFCISSYAFAQHTQTYTNQNILLQKGIQLFDNQLFSAAKMEFENYLTLPLNPEQIMQGKYYQLLASLYLGENNDKNNHENSLENEIKNFANQYPTSLQTANLYSKTADYYFEKNDYENAIRYYEPIKSTNLSNSSKNETTYKTLFNLGYAYFITEKYDAAKTSFDKIKAKNHAYMYASSYYVGYIEYAQNNDNEALTDLERAKTDNSYKNECDKIIPLIYYRRKDCQKVIDYFTENNTTNNTKILTNNELMVLGDSYYQQKSYLQAAKYLDRYAENQPKLDRNIAYKLAYALSEAGDNIKSQAYFSIVAEENDTLSQNAAYNLGKVCLAIKQKEPAINAFDKARKMTFDNLIQEKSALDYVKVCHELKDFTRTIEGCEYFERTFPNSTHTEEVANVLADSYLNSGNNIRALAYIEKTPNKTKKLQTTYQRLAYNQAVELFNLDRYTEAEIMLRKSLKYPVNKDLSNSSNYYLGEMYSYDEKYDSALIYYNLLTVNSQEFNEAFYSKGYADYNRNNYINAANNFQKYIELTSNLGNKSDAEIRLADCYYVSKNYENALKTYDNILQLEEQTNGQIGGQTNGQKGVDKQYLYFQKAMILANQEKFDESLSIFDKILLNDTQSKYYDQALYQKGLLNFELSQKSKSVELFTQLIETKPQSNLVPYCLSKRAICYQLLNDQQDAINDFRQIIQNYATHEVADDAIQGLQEMQEKGYEIIDYQILMEKFNKSNPNSKAALEGEYASAKSNYDHANYTKAIHGLQWFIKKYPDNELVQEAYYFLGASYDQNQDMENALFAYSKVKGNYETRALQRAAEIEFQRGNYTNAQTKYESMLKNTLNKRYEGNAMSGIMQCSFYLKNYDKVQDFANQIYNQNHTKFWSLADLYLAKIQIEKTNYSAAILQLQKTMQNAQDTNGAEAQYLVGVVLRKQKKYEESTKALIEVRNKYNNYTIWVYEAFLLIADNYVDLQNKFQAKATLQSVIDASTDEKIKIRATKRLAEIQ